MIDNQRLDDQLYRAARDVRDAFDELPLPEHPASDNGPRQRVLLLAAAASLALLGFGAVALSGTQGLTEVGTGPAQPPTDVVEVFEEPTAEAPTPDASESAPAIPEDDCDGGFFDEIEDAKASYSNTCGMAYDSSSGVHQCAWSTDGWGCYGPRAEGVEGLDDAAATPSPATATTPPDAPLATDDTSPAEPESQSAVPVPGSDRCLGDYVPRLEDAKASYSDLCGMTYDDSSGFHQCQWSTDGWRCGGPRGADAALQATPGSAAASTAPAEAGEPDPSLCYGPVDQRIEVAKDNYSAACGLTYSDTSGLHQCEWTTEGWRCRGPRSE